MLSFQGHYVIHQVLDPSAQRDRSQLADGSRAAYSDICCDNAGLVDARVGY